jgi:hypothetical protein
MLLPKLPDFGKVTQRTGCALPGNARDAVESHQPLNLVVAYEPGAHGPVHGRVKAAAGLGQGPRPVAAAWGDDAYEKIGWSVHNASRPPSPPSVHPPFPEFRSYAYVPVSGHGLRFLWNRFTALI